MSQSDKTFPDDVNPYASPEGASLAENPPVSVHPPISVWRKFFVWMFVSFPAAFVVGLITILGSTEIDPILEMRWSEFFIALALVPILGLAIWGLYQMRRIRPWPAIPQLCFGWVMIWWLFGAGVNLVHPTNIDNPVFVAALFGSVNSVIGIILYLVLRIDQPHAAPNNPTTSPHPGPLP